MSLKFKSISGDTCGRSCLRTEFSFEESVARLYNLSNQEIFFDDDDKDKITFEATGTYKGEVFTLYDWKGGQCIQIGGTRALDVVGFIKKLKRLLAKTEPKHFEARSAYTGERFSFPSKNLKYVMIKIDHNLGSDMLGTYFVQYTNNQKNIKKFLLINTNGNVTYYPKKYTREEIDILNDRTDLFEGMSTGDRVEILVLSGELKVPGKNKELDSVALECWWKKYLGSTKEPQWFKIVETIVDLSD